MDDVTQVSALGIEPNDFAEPWTEAELEELALSDDPDAVPADDAVPLDAYLALSSGPLPLWYMPSPMARVGKGWRTPVVLAIVAAFVLIEAFGLCSAYGQVVVG